MIITILFFSFFIFCKKGHILLSSDYMYTVHMNSRIPKVFQCLILVNKMHTAAKMFFICLFVIFSVLKRQLFLY